MKLYSVYAEWESLSAVRVHTPGLELWSGSLDPEANLFENHIPPAQARTEHERLRTTLERAGIDVHQLADDLELAGVLNEFVRDSVSLTSTAETRTVDIDRVLETFNPQEKLQLVLTHMAIENDTKKTWGSPTPLSLQSPLSNIYFQRDTTILGDRGPVLCEMYDPVRQPEIPLVRAAWEGIGAEIAYEIDVEPVEGGEFMPAGEFALLGVSAVIDGKEHVIRTSYDAGRKLLNKGAIGYNEVGLVRAPLEADRYFRDKHNAGS